MKRFLHLKAYCRLLFVAAKRQLESSKAKMTACSAAVKAHVEALAAE